MSKPSVGIRALSVSFPSVLRTNDYWREKYPTQVAEAGARNLARVFSPHETSAGSRAFDEEMAPFVDDPFRGTVERRILGPGETSLDLEARAVGDALAAAGISRADVDAMIVVSFMPDTLGVGNAAYLAKRLELSCAAWNLESGCTGAVVALQNAVALVSSGTYARVLVVVSCTYSRICDEADSLSWFMADGAGAFLVERVPEGEGVLGFKVMNSSATCGAFFVDMVEGVNGKPRLKVRPGPAHRLIRDTSAPFLEACCRGACEAAGVTKDDIDFFVFNTPVAWHHRFGARLLDVDPARTMTTYPSYANIGPALLPVNLHHAAQAGKFARGDLVLCYAVGSVSSAGAVVMRWGDVGLGPMPSPSHALRRG
jgi:3-oxoacyl-[acyl-carrier-protein] synthase-3